MPIPDKLPSNMIVMRFAAPERSFVDLSKLNSITYCINCLDSSSGVVGTFAFDDFLFNVGLGHFAISPVFNSVDEFYEWSKNAGFLYFSIKHNFVMQRDFPTK